MKGFKLLIRKLKENTYEYLCYKKQVTVIAARKFHIYYLRKRIGTYMRILYTNGYTSFSIKTFL